MPRGSAPGLGFPQSAIRPLRTVMFIPHREYMYSDQSPHSRGPSDPDPAGTGASGAQGVPWPRPPGDEACAPPLTGRLTLSNPNDVVATLPYLVGAPPDPGVIVMTLHGKGVRSVFCRDLGRVTARKPTDCVAAPVDTAVSEGADGLLIVAYGEPHRVTPYVDALRSAAGARGLRVPEAFRVTGERYWSYVCDRTECCPPEGVVIDVDRSSGPAGAVLHGLTPLPPLQQTLADIVRIRRILDPVDRGLRTAMAAATEQVEEQARRLAKTEERAFVQHGLTRVGAAIEAERTGEGTRDEEELAWLGVLLTEIRVRDEVWARITPETAHWHEELWSRVVRHVEQGYRAAPAALTAVAAWQRDDHSLARAALEVALDADPEYSMATLMKQALTLGLPVERWRAFLPRRLEGRMGWPKK